MIIKANTSFTGRISMRPNEVRDVPDDIAKRLVKAGFATEETSTLKKGGGKNDKQINYK